MKETPRWLALLGVSRETPVASRKQVVVINMVALMASMIDLATLPFAGGGPLIGVTALALLGFVGARRSSFGRRYVQAAVLLTLVFIVEALAHIALAGLASGRSFYLLLAVVFPLLCFRRNTAFGILFSLLAGGAYLGSNLLAAMLVPSLEPEPMMLAAMMLATCTSLVTLGYVEHRTAWFSEQQMFDEQQASEELLDNLLDSQLSPALDPSRLTASGLLAQRYPQVTVLSANVDDLAGASELLTPLEMIRLLDKLFSAFDELCDKHGGMKAKTLGDRYYVVFGAPEPGDGHAEAAVAMGRAMLEVIARYSVRTKLDLRLRVGIATGSLIIAVLGPQRTKVDLFGEAMFEAVELERHGVAGKLHLSAGTAAWLEGLEAEDILVHGLDGKMPSSVGEESLGIHSEETAIDSAGHQGVESVGDRTLSEERTRSTPSEDPIPGSVLAGSYRLDHEIGRGGMGAVFRGFQLSLQRAVAIKVLRTDRQHSPAVFARFQREIDLVGRLSHPNIVQIIDAGRTESGLTYLVMELLSGKGLNTFVPVDGLDPLVVVKLFAQACAGVEAAHAKGLIHRDLSPANVFIQLEAGAEAQAKILDFGLAKATTVVASEVDIETLTREDQMAGTPGFMAPEQINHEHEIGPHTDVYALGAVLYFMLCGKRPFAGKSAAAIVFSQLASQRRPFELAHGPFSTIIERALSLHPKDRHASVAELLHDLDAVELVDSGEAHSEQPEPRATAAAEMIPDIRIGTLLAGSYRLDEEIGRGGMGAVFRGFQLSLQRAVAIKVLRIDRRDDPGVFARFRREIDAVGRLAHPNIVQIIDAGVTEAGTTYLVMELLAGQSLGAFVPRGGLDPELAIDLIQQIGEGVQAAHNQGLIHRDLSPNNVFIHARPGRRPRAKILDFGLAKSLGSKDPKLTRENQMMGTPSFMAPEQINQSHEINPTTDVYALGALLYFMLGGRRAFEGNSAGAVIFNQLAGRVRPFDPCHSNFSELILRALSVHPDGRPASVADFLLGVERAIVGGESTLPHLPPVTQGPHSVQALMSKDPDESEQGMDEETADEIGTGLTLQLQTRALNAAPGSAELETPKT